MSRQTKLVDNPVYKMIKTAVPHCPICGDQLSGNNSIAHPYRCSCGTWKYHWMTSGYEIVLDNPKKGNL